MVSFFFLYRSLTGLTTAIRGLKHLLSSLFASTFASRAVSSTDNKFQQSDNLDLKTLPFLTIQLVLIPHPHSQIITIVPRLLSPNFNAVRQLQSKICPVIIGIDYEQGRSLIYNYRW